MVETIIKKQPGNETDLEPALAGNQETAKRQLKLSDEVFAIVADGPNQPKNFKFPEKTLGSKNQMGSMF